ncbi:MAG: hypothetical protein KH376_01865 [Holdemanella biformis]|uniref:hypothetical protein n=1 Tax=Holdemanella biformis TaxID=1735 RepID=UPI00242B2305|nr:hypothetical protein [Holdemanella biformis]MBS6454482.1 hypothetical protein [Holdemanella biformis]
MKTKQILMAGALALSMVLSGGMLTGCSNSSTKDTKTTEVAKKKEVKTIGQKSKYSKSLKITNSTGKKITVFETKSSSEESFSDNLLDDGDAVKNKEQRTLYYDVKENDKLDVKIGLQDQDKTFVFKDVDTTDTKKVDVSLKDDKVNLDITKKDGTTATLTPSEDSAKTEDEKKDEQEVKQEEKKEEKKEETAKADSSNKSNTSESKKENTTATTNTSSNKNNSSASSSKPSNGSSNNSGSSKPSNNSSSNSSSSKPAEHTHNWVAVTETRTVVDQPAYDEQVPVTEMREHEICSSCGADLTGTDTSAHIYQHMINGDDKGGWHSEWREEVTGYQTVHHDAVTHTETVTTGYRCSTCGASK